MLSYVGGKSKIGKWIKDYIPNDIETYVEPFGGQFWVYYNLELNNIKNVVYNDFNPLNVNIFNCVKNHVEFYDTLKDIKSQNSDLFYEYQKEIFAPNFQLDLSVPNYEVGYKYAYVLSQVWSGTNPEKAKFIDLKDKYTSKYDSFVKKLLTPKWTSKFDKIDEVENLDFEDVIKKYDSPTTYFYCDPPYYLTEKYYANHDFGLETHERLANCLKSIQGKFSLSYYDFPQLSEWFPKDEYIWKQKEFAKAAMAKAGKVQTKGTELLIMNYDYCAKD